METITVMMILIICFQGLITFFIGTLAFDSFHYACHKWLKSKSRILRVIGSVHSAHHRFFPATLQIQTAWAKQNLTTHVFAEYGIQVMTSCLCLYFFHPIAVFLAVLFQTYIFLTVCYFRGVDPHHKSYSILPSYRGGVFVSADYHALHHLYPDKFFSSYIKLFDMLFGTSQHLVGKKIAMTGASGALGSQMKTLLEKEGALVTTFKYGVDYDYHNYDKLKQPLIEADILLLCHGSKLIDAEQANCDSFIKIIELFKSVRQNHLTPIEIWGVGSEIECHPCFGIKNIKIYAQSKRNFAKRARYYFRDRTIQYRHIVHSAFISNMGPGLMTAKFAAVMTLFLIKRGFRYVPVTYTGFAWLNYFRFIFNI